MRASRSAPLSRKSPPKGEPRAKPGTRTPAVLLAGGNPQVAKGDGDAPVQAYIAALSGWKRDVVASFDALVVRSVPDVEKAVRWNSPFYRSPGRGYFASLHVFTRYVKVTFFDGLSLDPAPSGGTEKSGRARWIDLREGDAVDDTRMERWVKQAAALPGWIP